MIEGSHLAEVCRVLNNHHIRYAVAGGYACALHGHVRMTEDYDILLHDDDENLRNTIEAIYELFPTIHEDISITDIRDNIVLKVADEIEVDFSIRAWTLDFKGAEQDLVHAEINGVDIPYLGIDALIQSKETMREIDQWDVKVLREIKRNQGRI